jgi:hypothetical protein
MTKPDPSQRPQVDYTRRSYYVAIISVIVAIVIAVFSIAASYHIAQQSSKPTAEDRKLVSQQEAMPSPVSTPVPTPASVASSPLVSPSPSPKVEAKQRKPRKSSPPREEVVEGPCYIEGKGGQEEVDCETGEYIDEP